MDIFELSNDLDKVIEFSKEFAGCNDLYYTEVVTIAIELFQNGYTLHQIKDLLRIGMKIQQDSDTELYFCMRRACELYTSSVSA